MPGSNYDRDLTVKEGFKLSKFLVKWEMILVYILVLINVVLAVFRHDLYFTRGTIQSIINAGLDVSPMVLGMVFILLLGDIDVSVAAQMILGGMVTGLMMDHGVFWLIAVICGVIMCMDRGRTPPMLNQPILLYHFGKFFREFSPRTISTMPR